MVIFGAYIFVIFIATQLGQFGGATATWSYSGPTGPSNWGKLKGAAACLGRKQSPININTFETGQKQFPPFVMRGYDVNVPRGPTRPTSMVNNGHTLQVNLEGNYFISGGGLPNTYKAVQFHLHWSSDNSKGSEHTKNGEAYPGEMHIVHYNSDLFQNIGQAISKPNGIAQLGFWIKLGRHNLAWDPIINNLQVIKYANTPHIFTTPFTLSSLIPTDLTRFYRYEGSLMTPGCYETTTWTMFDNKITISRAQIAKLRQLSKFETPPYGPGAGPELHRRLIDNFRPIQRLWFRTVYQSWPHDSYSYYGGMDHNVGWNPKFKGTFSGYAPAVPGGVPGAGASAGAGAGMAPAAPAAPATPAGPAVGVPPNPGPARFAIGPHLQGDTGALTGLQRLWNALRNNEYEGQEADFYYAGLEYGNKNDDDGYYNTKYSFAKYKK